ncbi:MAG: UDP-N-acetylmuramate--alanine ligase, partial [Chloroflexota bacterium]|nr:UDP-N-acetylmuramate--alanine ligase [Chloroflexota bacterium]
MSALAHLYLERGDSVSGSDAAPGAVLDALAAAGARVSVGHDAANLGEAEVVVVSTAIDPANPELLEARRRALRVVSRGRAAADLAAKMVQVAVAGTHGKTTTTTMVAAALASRHPMVLSGGRLPGSEYNSTPGAGKLAVVEADESDGSFLELAPDIGVVTNVEADHLDRYRDLGEITRAFERFAARVTSTLVACVDDPGARSLLAVAPGEITSYGFSPEAELRGEDYAARAGGSVFIVRSPWGDAEVSLSVPGRHNAANAMAALAVGLRLGVSMQELLDGLAACELPGRRMELVGEIGGARVYDDYGHHPTEVAATLAAARELGAE